MTEKEAYDLLGLRPGASDDAVKKAYRHIIQKVHPDKGGTAALSRQVREAYELLTRKNKGTSQGSSGSASAKYADGAEERRKREEEAHRRKTEEQHRRSEEEQRKQRKRREEERLGKWRAHGRNREKLAELRLNLKNNRINLYASFLKFMGFTFLCTVLSVLFSTVLLNILPDMILSYMADYLIRLLLEPEEIIIAIVCAVSFLLFFYHYFNIKIKNKSINSTLEFLKFMGLFLSAPICALFTMVFNRLLVVMTSYDLFIHIIVLLIFFTVIFSLCFYHLGDDRVDLSDHGFDADIDIINSKKNLKAVEKEYNIFREKIMYEYLDLKRNAGDPPDDVTLKIRRFPLA